MSSRKRHRVIRTRGQQIAWTNTSPILDEQVVAGIKRVAAHVDLNRTVVHVKRIGITRASWGRAYRHIPSIANMEGLNRWQWRYLITVTDSDFLGTLAHEAKHVEQFRERKRISEVACDAFAAWLVDQPC